VVRLDGAVAIVTGGGRGLGRAVVQELTRRGAIARSCALHPEAGVDVVDVRRSDEVSSFVAEVERTSGPISILVNNAGWVDAYRDIEHVDDDAFRRYVDTNVGGAFYFMRAVIPLMRSRSRGRIVNVSSRAASKVHSGLALYSATKMAVRGLTQAVAKELATAGDFVCVSVSPAGIATPMRSMLFGEDDARAQQSPEAVARVVGDIIDGSTTVPSGADVEITNGRIADVTPMRQ